jgi:hypothetical protein
LPLKLHNENPEEKSISSADRENGKTVMEEQKGKKSYWG